jgi:hypothetical protein
VAELIEREAEAKPLEKPQVNLGGIEEVVADKGYHSGPVLQQMQAAGVRTYISEKKQTGKRHWVGTEDQQRMVYANRQRLQRPKGQRLLRKRGELIERTFAHCYDTGGMRRTYLRQHNNILKADPRGRSEPGIAAAEPVRPGNTERPARALGYLSFSYFADYLRSGIGSPRFDRNGSNLQPQNAAKLSSRLLFSLHRFRKPKPDFNPGLLGGFTFNSYLLADDELLLFHTGYRKLFPVTLQAIAKVMRVAG